MKKEKSNSPLPIIIIVIMMATGLGLLLYPTIADMINDSQNQKAISEYKDNVESLGESEYQKILEAISDYNKDRAEHTPYLTKLTAEERAVYESLLNDGGNGLIGYIEVEKSDVYLGIYHGTDESVLQTGAGHLESSSLPAKGESVHVMLTGHSGLPSARLFTDLDKLKPGDNFTLHILNETLVYEVQSVKRVLPEELESLKIEQGQELCTLITCTPYGVNTHRLTVTGKRIDAPEKTEDLSSAEQTITSTWNWWFVFLPAVIFILMTAGVVILLYFRNKKKKAPFNKEDNK